MAKKKYYYYVLVFSENGAMYVTSIDSTNKYAHWDATKAPLELGASYAEDLVFGLNCNFINAVVVKSKMEIETQPFNYADFECKFVRREENK